MKKFTLTKMDVQDMADKNIDKNVYVFNDRKTLGVYTFIGIIALFLVGTTTKLIDPTILATLFN